MLVDILIVVIAVILIGGILGFRFVTERHWRRRRMEEIIYDMIMDNSLLAAVMAILLLAILFVQGKSYNWHELIDFKILATLILSFLVGILLVVLRRYLINRLEDGIKLTTDYQGLIKKYSAETKWYSYENYIVNDIAVAIENDGKKTKKMLDLLGKEVYQFAKDEDGNIAKTKEEDGGIPTYKVVFPILVDALSGEWKVVIDDSEKDDMFKLPEEADAYKDALFKAHDTSHLYNQLNIHVIDWSTQGDNIILKTSRTTYFKSMVTNRALDYRLPNEMTMRDVLQYGPFVPSLSESSEILSNHLGVNGFVITKESNGSGRIPLVLRRGELSIAKRSYGPSVGASLKTKYCLNDVKSFNEKGLYSGIIGEIYDELKISQKLTPADIHIVAAYRDIVEGNKPQLLFFTRIEADQKTFLTEFNEAISKKKKDKAGNRAPEDQKEEDGDTFVWLAENELSKIIYLPNGIIVNERKLPATPSTVVSLLLLKEYLEKNKVKQ